MHYNVMWKIEYEYIKDWLAELDAPTRDCVTAAVEVLAHLGPALGRPLVDVVVASRHANMKELRPPSPGATEFRILFAFDPDRSAVLLLGGDKSGMNSKKAAKRDRWSKWYKKAVAEADRRYDEHLAKLQRKGRD